VLASKSMSSQRNARSSPGSPPAHRGAVVSSNSLQAAA
jgi:hypothetical protein